jgi:hypothetical protein
MELNSLISTILSRITPTITVDSVDVVSGGYRFNTANTYYLRENKTLTIDSVDYIVSSFVQNTSFTILTDTDLSAVTSVSLYTPVFLFGSPTSIQKELMYILNESDRTPIILVHQLLRERNYKKEWDNPVEQEWEFTLFIMDTSKFGDWLTTDHYRVCVKPMRALAELFQDEIEEDQKLFEELENVSITPRPNFGIYTTDKGEMKQLYSENFSGVEMSLVLKYRKQSCELSNPFVPPSTVITKINDVSVASTTCGTTVNVQVENTDGTELGSNVSGTWTVGDITVTDSDGSTFSSVGGVDVTCTLARDVVLNFNFLAGTDTSGLITIDSDSAGTYTATTNDGSSGDITIDKNGTGYVAFSSPLTLEIGDTLQAKRSISTGAGWVKINGTY